jgi:hypothetical protein
MLHGGGGYRPGLPEPPQRREKSLDNCSSGLFNQLAMTDEPVPGVQLPGSSQYPEPRIRRSAIWTWLSLGALVVFEIAMVVYFLVSSPKSRPDSFIGIWIAGSGALATLLVIAQGITARDVTRSIAVRGIRYRGDNRPDPNRR